MVSKKVIIGAVIAVAVVAIAVIALSGEEEPNARLNCKVELADSFTSMGLMGPYQQMPDEGMKYAILTYKVVNDYYPDSIETVLNNSQRARSGPFYQFSIDSTTTRYDSDDCFICEYRYLRGCSFKYISKDYNLKLNPKNRMDGQDGVHASQKVPPPP